MTSVRRLVCLILLALSLGWLFLQAPIPFLREAWFVAVMLGATIGSRSVPWNVALSGLGLGMSVASTSMIGLGWLLAQAGLDVSEGGPGSWTVVPVLEELVKLGTVFGAAWLYQRRSRLQFNPSDWLLVGCAVGAGFAMVENAQLVAHDPGVLRDMARQYGPWVIVPGAWGVVGYVGHAAATGFAAGGIGLANALRRGPGGKAAPLSWIVMVAPLAWVTLEHVLANLRVDTGSRAALVFGNGRLTPWLFVAFAILVVALDLKLAQRALAHSAIFRNRAAASRALLSGTRLPRPTGLRQRLSVVASERRLLNAAAWVSLERLTAGKAAR